MQVTLSFKKGKDIEKLNKAFLIVKSTKVSVCESVPCSIAVLLSVVHASDFKYTPH